MKELIKDCKFDTRLIVSDWRYSASTIGLMKYFKYHDIDFDIDDDSILYNSSDITEERYFNFVEYYFYNDLHHTVIEDILQNEEFTEEQIKLVNEKLKANSVMKKVFKNIKFDSSNAEEIIKLINANRLELIKETFRRKAEMYATFCNPNRLFTDRSLQCRLESYYVDESRKINSVSYKFNKSTYASEDCIEFDFVVFSFSRTREHIFINDNYTVKRLKQTQDYFDNAVIESDCRNSRQVLFNSIIEYADFVARDVEVIVKSEDKEYYETMFIRRDTINVLKNIKANNIDYKAIITSIKITDKYYIDIQKETIDCILNNTILDTLIEKCIKHNRNYVASQLIKINTLIRRGDNKMNDKMKVAYACAREVSKKIESNKVESFKNKLLSAVTFKDYDKACTILMRLSVYSKVEFSFIYSLFDNFEENKDIIYTFITALSSNK